MTTRPAKPAHMPWLSPYLTAKNSTELYNFYQKAFGFKPTEELVKDDAGNVMHAALSYCDTIIMMGMENDQFSQYKSPKSSGVASPIHLYVYCENVDNFYKHALANGAKSIKEPEDAFWGDRMCVIEDPEGYHWTFATNVGEHQ